MKRSTLIFRRDQKVCPECGALYTRVGEEYFRTEYNIIPARIEIIKWYRVTYRCKNCSGNGAVPELIKSRDGQVHMLHGMASASTVAWAAYQKFCQGVPLYRQEKDWEQMGVDVVGATLCSWLIKTPNEFYTFVTTGVYLLNVTSALEPPSIEKAAAELAPAIPNLAAAPSN